MANYFIKIDNREKDLINLLKERDYDVSTENLDIGDIQFLDIETKEIIIIIERKTYSDLSSSLKDGRYKEQKERMIHSLKNKTRKIMLIEGSDFTDFSLALNIYNSIITNTLIRDNISIHYCKNLGETLEFIENIILQLPKYYDDLRNEIINDIVKDFNNAHACSSKKKENLNSEICFRNMLVQIPGVSANIANIYMEKYKNMENFIKSLKNDCSDDGIKIIKNISDEKFGSKNRRVGEKVAEKIYYNIFDVSTDFTVKTEKKKINKNPKPKMKKESEFNNGMLFSI